MCPTHYAGGDDFLDDVNFVSSDVTDEHITVVHGHVSDGVIHVDDIYDDILDSYIKHVIEHEPNINLLDERDVIKYDADYVAISIVDEFHQPVIVVDTDCVIINDLGAFFLGYLEQAARAGADFESDPSPE